MIDSSVDLEILSLICDVDETHILLKLARTETLDTLTLSLRPL